MEYKQDNNRDGASANSGKSEDSQYFVQAPSVSLPKGGGAISGIGEKFAANPVSGTGSMSVPIATSPGRAGFGPQLSLSYDSGSGNGIFGFGWSLAVPSISRKTNKGLPRYLDADSSDVFILSGAEDLVPALNNNNDPEVLDSADGLFKIHRYYPRIEGLFSRIERWTQQLDGDVHWRSLSKENILTIYGKNSNARIVDPEDSKRIFSWLICEIRDDKGNAIIYDYKADDGVGVDFNQIHEANRGTADDQKRSTNRYLKRIRYGNLDPLLENGRRPLSVDSLIENTQWMFEAVFDYGEHDEVLPTPDDLGQWHFRQDAFSTYRSGFEVRTTRLCRRVLMFHHFSDEAEVGENCLVRSTDFNYSHQRNPVGNPLNPAIYSFLDKVTQTGYKRNSGLANNAYLKSSLPPVEFEYSQPIVQERVEEIDPNSLENLPLGVNGSNHQCTDLHGEGIPGILSEQAGSWWFKRNISPISEQAVAFSPLEQVASQPNMSLAAGARFMDLEGNGQLDLVMLDGPVTGRYQHDKQQGWHNFQPFTSKLNRSFQDPNLKFLDINGDGHADLIISEDNAFIWHASLAEAGFGPAKRVSQALDEETGPKLVFADISQTLFLADMNGDGLTDLVRIRNGEICYWANQGYCRFSAKIRMDNAPHFDHPDQFEHSRLRLADIDGSGTIDIIYLHSNGVRLYFNQSGNSWSEAQTLKVQPKVDEIVSIATADLLGNGTACLVWSSPLPGDSHQRMRYVNLMGAQKPHLLIKTHNNLGATTEMVYAPSSQFYLADKAAGEPWLTKLPFPVHVVEKVISTDKWSGTKFTTSYSYHHGYFDGIEREFRGFARVEQVDIEAYGGFAAGNINSPFIDKDRTLYQPPIKTISWFHTGAAIDRTQILAGLQKEYFKPPNGFVENVLPEPDLDQSDLTTDEWREALRACKGLPLRQEVYELDVKALANRQHQPVRLFSTSYHNCNIQRLQPQANNRHGVFLVTESEAINYQYDLDLKDTTAVVDPRIAHTLNLNIDSFGNVLQSVAVVYPRIGQYVDPSLPHGGQALIQQVQGQTHLAYTENRFTNDIAESNNGATPSDSDNYRLRMPCEVLTFELTGISPVADYYRLSELQKLRLSTDHQTDHQTTGIAPQQLAYHQTPNHNDLEQRLIEHLKMHYFTQNLSAALALGELNSLGLPFETYKLALTTDLLSAVFAEKLTAEILADLDNANKSGYLKDNNNQYWIRSGIAGFADDAAAHFFLPEKYTDPFGGISTLQFDPRDLFVQSSIDAVGNTASIEKFDYRVLAPTQLKDLNNNISEVVFDTLGMPSAAAVKGKGNEADNLSGFNDALIDLSLAERLAFFSNDYSEDEARRLLGNASMRHVYDFGEQLENDGSTSYGHRPASAAAIVREQHVAQLEFDQSSPLQVAFEYSDGSGNLLVTKNQAEPASIDGPLRWISNGKTILNNKGKPVKQYQPYFTNNQHFEEPIAVGVSPVMYYDAAGRLIRTESPDGSYSRVEFSPWHVSSFDANDTVLEVGNLWHLKHSTTTATLVQQQTAAAAAVHANTPAQVFLDSLGRDVIGIEHNKFLNANDQLIEEKHLTFTKLDAEGKPLWIRDSRNNCVMQYIMPPLKPILANNESVDPISSFVPCYDIAGNLLFQHSMDGGDRWMIFDASGESFYAWDENEQVQQNGSTLLENRLYHTQYDALRRPLQQQLQINGGEIKVIERLVYAENHPQAFERNLNGQLFQHYDSSGLITAQRFDFKGGLEQGQRQFAAFTETPLIHWPENPEPESLEETYSQNTRYDALGRMVRQENWHIQGRLPAIYTPQYNQRGALVSEKLTVNNIETTPIVDITLDAKGQRTQIQYDNNTETSYQYDPETFRLTVLRTRQTLTNRLLQDLHYSYDPVGNISAIRDDAQQTVFFNNAVVRPDCSYQYDALYRLILAKGREHDQGINIPQPGKTAEVLNDNIPNDHALRNYQQRYHYDAVGNIKKMEHAATNGSWTRHYAYAEDSNRLLKTWQGADEINAIVYQYDTHGSMLNLNNTLDEFKLRWDHNDMIQHINLGGGGDAFYRYAADKERYRKRIVRSNGDIEERLYLGGMERYRFWKNGNAEAVEEIETYHLFDGEQRMLMVERVFETLEARGLATLFRYQYGNHLGSVGLELNEAGEIISYEEYHPFGTTAYSASNDDVRSTVKRYKYTGMERDEESGLSYHSARYYLPWLGRWASVDPIGVGDGDNVYRYVSNNHINYIDPSGKKEYDTMKAIQNGTSELIQESRYDWLEADRLNRTQVWKDAMAAITMDKKAGELAPFAQVRDYYIWVQNELDDKGHEVRWAWGGIALVDELADNFEEGVTLGKGAAGLSHTTQKLLQDLNVGIADYAVSQFHELLYGKFKDTPLKGFDAEKFDYDFIDYEQRVVAKNVYDKYLRSGQAVSQLNDMARREGVKGFWSAQLSSISIPDFGLYKIDLTDSSNGEWGRVIVPFLMLHPSSMKNFGDTTQEFKKPFQKALRDIKVKLIDLGVKKLGTCNTCIKGAYSSWDFKIIPAEK